MQLQLLVFRVGTAELAVDVFSVHEVLRPRRITALPKAPAFVEGVIDLRGALIPVIDLRRRFELPRDAESGNARLIVVELGTERVGILVDSVTEVLAVPEASISPPPDYFRGLAAEYIRGIVRLEERLIILVDLEQILSSEERIALEQAAEWSGTAEDASSG